eukprot:12621221-Alexandrium_andersonii.AAC.1
MPLGRAGCPVAEAGGPSEAWGPCARKGGNTRPPPVHTVVQEEAERVARVRRCCSGGAANP